MDAFELLLQATGGFNENSTKPLSMMPTTEQIHSSLLDPIDSIMMLADQAVKQNPVDKPASWKDFGPYFSQDILSKSKRGRAMSEPWTTKDAQTVSMKYVNPLSSKHGNGMSGIELALPHMMDKYSAIYNKGGRVGIYTKEERNAIINRFQEKRKRRVWKKKIRYFCRKNLADRRVRVKGRFVKAGGKIPKEATELLGEEEEDSDKLVLKFKRVNGNKNSSSNSTGTPSTASNSDHVLMTNDSDGEEEGDGISPGDESDLDSEERSEERSGRSQSFDEVFLAAAAQRSSEEALLSHATQQTKKSTITTTTNNTTTATPNSPNRNSNAKLHFLASMLGEYVEDSGADEVISRSAKQGSDPQNSSTNGDNGDVVLNALGEVDHDDALPRGKKMRRHSIAY